jgi:hypothetical protein
MSVSDYIHRTCSNFILYIYFFKYPPVLHHLEESVVFTNFSRLMTEWLPLNIRKNGWKSFHQYVTHSQKFYSSKNIVRVTRSRRWDGQVTGMSVRNANTILVRTREGTISLGWPRCSPYQWFPNFFIQRSPFMKIQNLTKPPPIFSTFIFHMCITQLPGKCKLSRSYQKP